MQRLLFLLVAKPEVPADLEARLRPAATKIAKVCANLGVGFRHGYQLNPDPLSAAAGERTLVPLNAVFEVTVEDRPAAADLRSVVEQVVVETAEVIDPSQTALAFGAAHVILPERGPLMLVAATHRRTDLTPAQFHEHWHRRHAPLALSMMSEQDKAAEGYVQVHTDLLASAQLAQLSGFGTADFDGVLECSFDSVDTFFGLHARPEFAAAIYADEANFVDLSSEFRGAFLRLVE
jgi:hypothetical protein